MKKNLLWLICWFIPAVGLAQLNGVVKDSESGEPLIGASVSVPGENTGTITDSNGQFSLRVEQMPARIRVTYVGYQSQEIIVNEQQEISVDLLPQLEMEEVVIRAIRGGNDLPLAQTTIRRKELEKSFYGQDALFLLEKLVPSLMTYSESGTGFSNYGQLRLRGIDQTRVNITLNGVPLNDMIDQGVFFSNFTDFGNSIESVQVQRGVGTSSNGTASYAGSINFESVSLSDSLASAEVQLVAGAFNTWRASGELKSGLIDKKFSFYSRFSSISSEGFRNNTSTDSYSFFFSGGWFGKNDLLKVTGFTGRSKNGLAYSPVALSDIRDNPRTNYQAPADIDDFGQSQLQVQYNRSIGPDLYWSSTGYFGSAGGDYPVGFNVTDSIYHNGSYSLQERFTQINYPLFNRQYGFLSTVNYQISANSDLSAGIHGYTFRRNNQEIVIPDADPYYDEHSVKNEISAFMKGNYRWKNLELYGDLLLRKAGLNIDPDQSLLPQTGRITLDWIFLNPKIGFNYFIDSKHKVYLFFGRSGREPTKVDLLGGFQLNASNLDQLQNEEVKPEFVNDLEAGYEWNHPDFRFNLNAFYMDFTNEIAPIGAFVPEGFLQLRKNILSSYRTGLELDFTWKPFNNIELSGSSTYMRSRIREYRPEGFSQAFVQVEQALNPEWQGNGRLLYRLKQWLELETSVNYAGESFLEPTNQPGLVLPAFWVMNGRIGLRFDENISLDLLINNIFDQLYYTYGAPVDPDFDGINEPGYFVQPPRHLYGMLKVKF